MQGTPRRPTAEDVAVKPVRAVGPFAPTHNTGAWEVDQSAGPSTSQPKGDVFPGMMLDITKLQSQMETLRTELESVYRSQLQMEGRLKGYVHSAINAAMVEADGASRAKNLKLPKVCLEEAGTEGNQTKSPDSARIPQPGNPVDDIGTYQPILGGEFGGIAEGLDDRCAESSSLKSRGGHEFQRQLSLFGECSSENIAEYRKLERQAIDGNSQEVTTYDLKMNMWSCGIFTLVEDVPYLWRGHNRFESLIRMVTILGVLALNVILQCSFLYFISQDLLSPAIHLAQEMYARYHAIAFDEEGQFLREGFALLGAMKGDLCQIPLSKVLFLSAVLFLWVTTCLRSFLELLEDIYVFQRLPKLPAGIAITHMFAETDVEEGACDLLVCLSPWTRVFLWVLIFIPQVVIILVVFLLGCDWLLGTLNFGDLILNSLALEFVTGIDELLFECFMPQRLKDNLTSMKVVYPTYKKPPLRRMGTQSESMLTPAQRETKAEDLVDLKRAYSGSLITLSAVVLALVAVLYFQQVIPDYQWDVHAHCEAVVEKSDSFLCPAFQQDCFPYGHFSHEAEEQGADLGMHAAVHSHHPKHGHA